LQSSIDDAHWLIAAAIDGGAHAKARIMAWKSGKLWFPLLDQGSSLMNLMSLRTSYLKIS
jgi:hypothetical protein